MNVFVVGSGWIGRQVAVSATTLGYHVSGCSSPTIAGPHTSDLDKLCEWALDRPRCMSVDWKDLNTDCLDMAEPDLILSAGNTGCFITGDMIAQAGYGAVGYHPSLLPRHRGGDALEWTIRMRDPIAGGTLFLLDEGADTGPVIDRDWCFVRPDDTASSLWKRSLGQMGVEMFERFLLDFRKTRVIKATPQEEEFATWEPVIKRPKMGGRSA